MNVFCKIVAVLFGYLAAVDKSEILILEEVSEKFADGARINSAVIGEKNQDVIISGFVYDLFNQFGFEVFDRFLHLGFRPG